MGTPSFGLAALALCFVWTPVARGDWVFVGSWQVDQGPSWTTGPLIYTGQDAAALLFGGSPGDYAISTVDSNPANINFMAWYSPWGGTTYDYTGQGQPNGDGNFPVGILAPQSYFADWGGSPLHYDHPADVSSYVNDWAAGSFYTNFAFVDIPGPAVPEPSSVVLLSLGGLGCIAVYRRRKPATRE